MGRGPGRSTRSTAQPLPVTGNQTTPLAARARPADLQYRPDSAQRMGDGPRTRPVPSLRVVASCHRHNRRMSSPPASQSFVDTGKLIHMVRTHPVLYDINHVHYKDNESKNEIWNRISNDLGLDIETTKTKWRNLRDSFVKYLKCTKMKGTSLRKYSRWPWASKMEFLKPFLPAKFVKLDDDQDEAQEGYADHADHQENGGDEEEDRKVFDILQIKRAKLHSPEDLMARRVSNMEAIDHLFLSYAQTMKTFSHKRQVMIKSQLATMMNQAELEEIAEQEDPLSSLQHHLDYEYN